MVPNSIWTPAPKTVFSLISLFSFRRREREKESEQGRGLEGERENLKKAPLSVEPDAGLDPTILGSWPQPQSRVGCSNQLSHVGTLNIVFWMMCSLSEIGRENLDTVKVIHWYITNYPRINSLKQHLFISSLSFWVSGIWDRLSLAARARGLSWICSQDVRWGCTPLKTWLDWRIRFQDGLLTCVLTKVASFLLAQGTVNSSSFGLSTSKWLTSLASSKVNGEI